MIYLGNDAIIIAPSSGTATNSPVPYSSTIGEYDIGSRERIIGRSESYAESPESMLNNIVRFTFSGSGQYDLGWRTTYGKTIDFTEFKLSLIDSH